MNPVADSSWEPDPQLLAAYFDGELEGRDDLADLRARIEGWVEMHPEAARAWAEHRKLQKLWLDTTPAEPSEAAWQESLARIQAERKAPRAKPSRRWLWPLSAAACVFLVVGLGTLALRTRWNQQPTPPVVIGPKEPVAPKQEEPVEVFAVALASEITILRVEGADTASLVVGVPPVDGELELANVGDVRIVLVRPDARDQRMPNVRQDGQHRPMVWARADTDDEP